MVLAFLTSAPAGAITGVQYKLHLEVKGYEHTQDTDKNLEQETHDQTANWTFKPKDVNVWLPKFNGPPGQANAGETEVATAEEKIGAKIGTVEDHGTYAKFPQGATEPVAEPYSCEGPIAFVGPIINRVIVTPLDPTIELETDFHGSLNVLEGEFKFGNTFGAPCWSEAGQEEHGYFNFQWDNPHGQRIQVGALIPQQEIGQPFVGGPVEDYNNVATSESSEECFASSVSKCEVTFKLGGEYDLEKICEGTFESSWSCGSGSGSSGNNQNNNNSQNSQKSPGGGKEKEEAEKKKKEEEAKAAAKKKEEETTKKKEAEAHATVRIESVKLSGGNLLVKVKTSQTGTVTISGVGLKKTSTQLSAGVHALKVTVSKKAKAKHQKTRLTVSLKVGAKIVSATKKLTL